MHPQARFGLIIGAIVGAALWAFFMFSGGNGTVGLIFIPIGALMGYAPWLLKPKNEE